MAGVYYVVLVYYSGLGGLNFYMFWRRGELDVKNILMVFMK